MRRLLSLLTLTLLAIVVNVFPTAAMAASGEAVGSSPAITGYLIPEAPGQTATIDLAIKPLSSGPVCNYEVCMALIGSGLHVETWLMSAQMPPESCTSGRYHFQGDLIGSGPRLCTGADPATYNSEVHNWTAWENGTACNTADYITGKPCAGVHS